MYRKDERGSCYAVEREDKQEVLKIADYLQRRGVRCYVDVFDPELKTTSDITKTLMERVSQCSHLMAVVSGYTEKSWWVPFEIGVASELDRRITSYQLSRIKFPEFLEKWPILTSSADLDDFVNSYRRDRTILATEDAYVFDAVGREIRTAEQFHDELKQKLKIRRFY